MSKIKVKLTNDFHGTECFVLASADGELSHSQIKRAQRKLCGISDCTCGDVAGCRPCQVEQISQERYEADNRYKLI